MKEERLLITVIVAVLNCSKTLEHCIKSITEQSYPCVELIIMDGGSTDGSLSIINSYSDKIAYWESKPDRGIYHAWNKALKNARGEWICFLGADDYFWNDRVLADLTPHLIRASYSGIKVLYGQAARVDCNREIIKLQGKPWNKIGWQMRHGMPIQHTGLMHHRSLFEDHGLFDESFLIAGDYEFLLRELKNDQAVYVSSIRTVGRQVGGISDSSNLEVYKEFARARRKNGLHSLSWVWALVYARAWLRLNWYRLIDTKGRGNK